MACSAYATTSIIPFDTGRSYVVRSLPLERTEYRFEDSMGRTEKDKAFLNQFETLFLAASKGDLATCKGVVDQGFRDFNAYSVGRFGTGGGSSLDNISPLQIAQDRGHTEVAEFFKKFMSEKYSPQAYDSELDLHLQQLDAAMKGIFSLTLDLDEERPTPPKINNTRPVKSALPIPEILNQSSNHVLLKRPDRIQIDEKGLTRYATSQKIEVLIEELKERGPLIALGKIGPGCYVNDASKLDGKFCGEELYGWKPGATRKESSKQNCLLIIGAKKNEDRELVYFVLSQDMTANQDSSIREHKPSNKVYVTSHKTFSSYLSELYPCTSLVEGGYIQMLCSMPLDSILKEREAECKAIGQKAFNEFKEKSGGNSFAAKEAVQDLCDSILSIAKDGALRKRYVESAWGGIGDDNWRWHG